MVDGPGFRTSIYAAGCDNKCKGCHNPQSWDINNGTLMEIEDIMKIIVADPFANVSFSGGDPMFQAEQFAELAMNIKKRTDKTIWCWTGYLFEMLVRMPKQRTLLEYVDVLVDGPFIEAQKEPDLLFRGSANQRLIDVPKSLLQGKVVPYFDEMTMVS